MKQPLILDGRVAAENLIQQIKTDVDALKKQNKRVPGLLVIQVGENPASGAYIRQKRLAAEKCGFLFIHKQLSRTSNFLQILAEVRSSANDALIDGMIVQLPLDTDDKLKAEEVLEILEAIPPTKDADGLHSFNQGKLFTGESSPEKWSHPIPATPLGIYRLLEFYLISLSGKDLTVVGKSRLVGLPFSILAAHAGATVTVCNRLTQNLPQKTQSAEILIVAAGKKHLIGPEHVREGALVVDVGIHVNEDRKLSGDVSPEVYTKLAGYSPVPGGVGPMTVACLMENTYRLRFGQEKSANS